uniref:Uncharacterized protein n=1 Tax=Steinernema glaseri TaxID=37863 RepID=A0A1I7ZL92_9BILA
MIRTGGKAASEVHEYSMVTATIDRSSKSVRRSDGASDGKCKHERPLRSTTTHDVRKDAGKRANSHIGGEPEKDGPSTHEAHCAILLRRGRQDTMSRSNGFG